VAHDVGIDFGQCPHACPDRAHARYVQQVFAFPEADFHPLVVIWKMTTSTGSLKASSSGIGPAQPCDEGCDVVREPDRSCGVFHRRVVSWQPRLDAPWQGVAMACFSEGNRLGSPDGGCFGQLTRSLCLGRQPGPRVIWVLRDQREPGSQVRTNPEDCVHRSRCVHLLDGQAPPPWKLLIDQSANCSHIHPDLVAVHRHDVMVPWAQGSVARILRHHLLVRKPSHVDAVARAPIGTSGSPLRGMWVRCTTVPERRPSRVRATVAQRGSTSDNEDMVVLEAVLVLGIVGILLYATIRLLTRPEARRHPASLPGQWRVAHYDAADETRVVLQKISNIGAAVVDEHVIATVPVDDPGYDAKFLTAMSTARERRALFEAEEEA
jgi:hypothetical protein